MTYRYGKTTYVIQVNNPHGVNRGVCQLLLDGVDAPDAEIPLMDDLQCHHVQVQLGATVPEGYS